MKKMKLITLMVIITLISCNKNADTGSSNGIYIVGQERNIATIWKNGIATSLADGRNYSSANSVFVYGNDVYVAGFENVDNSKTIAKLWKNGVATDLTDGTHTATANSVFVFGNDVYVAGVESNEEKSVAKLWKNGVAIALTDGTNNAVANSVFVSGNDVYVAGYEEDGVNCLAKLWKNGNPMSLVISNTFNSSAKSVYVSGRDVYIAGDEGFVAKVWKNGVGIPMPITTMGSTISTANSVYVSGKNVYVAGNENLGIFSYFRNPTAKVWKNGSMIPFKEESFSTSTKGFFVLGNDIYVIGKKNGTYAYGTPITPTLWKNGVSIFELTGSASFNSIFVK